MRHSHPMRDNWVNCHLLRPPFRMLTLKQILVQIRPGNWFLSLDLKNALFHIQIAPLTPVFEINFRQMHVMLATPHWKILTIWHSSLTYGSLCLVFPTVIMPGAVSSSRVLKTVSSSLPYCLNCFTHHSPCWALLTVLPIKCHHCSFCIWVLSLLQTHDINSNKFFQWINSNVLLLSGK